jgi:hypothetical protein
VSDILAEIIVCHAAEVEIVAYHCAREEFVSVLVSMAYNRRRGEKLYCLYRFAKLC